MTIRFSLISAIYNVGRYLDDYFASLDAQVFDHTKVQVVLVDDGSTDDSPERIDAWAATTDYRVTVIRKENGGQSSARNMGIEAAEGDWLSFPDPDDMLVPAYLDSLDRALTAHPEADMAVANLINFWEDRGEYANTHPLRFRFNGDTQIYDLLEYPRNVHLHASSGFFARSAVIEGDIRFDERIKPVFEDGHFVQSYLLARGSTRVISESRAVYHYRRRADSSSTLQTSGAKPTRYTDVFRYGHLDLLSRAAAEGPIPEWLQFAVLYDIFWVLRNQESLSPDTGAVPRATAEEFARLLTEVVAHLDDRVIRAFDLISPRNTQREVLLHAARGQDWHTGYTVVRDYDRTRRLVLLTYRYTGQAPEEEIRFRGVRVEPVHEKTRARKYLGIPMLWEREIWISSRGVSEVWLNGERMPVRYSERQHEPQFLRPAVLRRAFSPARGQSRLIKTPPLKDVETMVLWKGTRLKERFADAWVFMDRIQNANDNAEHLFKYVREHRPDINAWFVLEKNSPDWHRLREEGVDRLIAHGSQEWRILCLAASVLLSSHIDVAVVAPFRMANGRRPTWDYVFLQHGVTQNDLSQWLNSKRIALMLTATPEEYRSIVGDGSAYKLSDKEVALTGFPRFDALDRKAEAVRRSEATHLTVMPTWRKSLAGYTESGPSGGPDIEGFRMTEFAQQWSALLSSEKLATTLREHGLTLRFMPHPNLEPFIEAFDVPDTAEVRRYRDINVQDALVSSRALITDYSSVIFDGAYIGRPTTYFQFDVERMYAGEHIALPGYFDYAAHGFGPVTFTADTAVAAVASLLDDDSPEAQRADARMAEAFPLPAGENCARTLEALERRLVPADPRAQVPARAAISALPTRYVS